MKLKKGLLIALEGIDGSGKAVQGRNLTDWLEKQGCRVRNYTYPDLDSKYGEILNDFLKGESELDERTQFLTFAADIMKDQLAIQNEIERGRVVVMDRYILSTVAYQCAKGMPFFDALRLVKMIQPLPPDMVIWFDVPPQIGVARRKKKKGNRRKDVHDADLELLRRVRTNYTRLHNMRWLGKKWVRINGKKQIKEISEEIRSLISPMLK